MTSYFKSFCLGAVSLFSTLSLLADTIVLPNPANGVRTASLGDAISGTYGNSLNPSVTTIGNAFGGSWLNEGELTAAGSNDWLKITLDAGKTWGTDVSGTWEISADFWQTWGRAVISMHVGHGGGDPDYFAWEITSNNTSGSFSYQRLSGTGGGLSNIKLWGSGTPSVSEGGSTVLLLGAALLGLAAAARRRRA
ncbi:MAG: hypothetical protein JNG83_04145 [Opitutaceae bacterium]|nr:hypothetical protein [Opitutaceae bacterium]